MKPDRLHDETARQIRLAVVIVALVEAVASGALAIAKAFGGASSTVPLWSLCGLAVVAFVAAAASVIRDRRATSRDRRNA